MHSIDVHNIAKLIIICISRFLPLQLIFFISDLASGTFCCWLVEKKNGSTTFLARWAPMMEEGL